MSAHSLNIAKVILVAGSFIALFSGLLAAFTPGLAYVTVSAEWANFLLPDAPHYVTYQPLTFSINDLTIKLLVTAIGGFLGVLSVFERKTAVPYLSFAGISMGAIGFLLPTGANSGLTDVLSVNVPWIGSLIALCGVLLMFIGFVNGNSKVPRLAIVVVPILLFTYLISPVLIFTDNLAFFIYMQANISMSTIMGVLVLAGHFIIIWAGINGLRVPEREASKAPPKILKR
jgi:hypothetical protein